MKAKCLLYLSASSAILAGAAQAIPSAANIYWTGANQQAFYDLKYLSTDPNTIVNPTEKDFANWTLGKFNWTSAANAFMYLEANRETTLKGIYWGDTTTSYDTILQMYNNGSMASHNTSLVVTDGITLDCSSTTGNTITIRRRQNGGFFSVVAGDVSILKKGVINFGNIGTGEYLTSLGFSGNVNITNNSALNIYANSFQMAVSKSVTLDNSGMYFMGGVNESSGSIPFAWANINMATNKMSFKGASTFRYGKDYLNYGTGSVALGGIDLASADVKAYIDIYAEGDKSVGAVSSSVAGGAGSLLYFKTNNELLTVESMNTSVETIQMASAVNITGNFVDNHAGTKTILLLTTQNASFTVDGTFSTTNKLSISLADHLGNGIVGKYSFGGIVGDSNGFITTGFVGGDRSKVGQAQITLTGSGVYESFSKITDMSYNETGSIGSFGTISIIKNGTGTQYLRGATWYRGDTVVNSGKLYIAADGFVGRMPGADLWGIGKIVLNGGTFGAVGATKEIAELYATKIEMKGGELEFSFNDLDSDVIILLDKTSAVMSATEAALFKFLFVIEDPVRLDTNYKIVEWDASIGALEYDTSKFLATITGQNDIKAIFSYADDGGLNVMFVAIPEPALLAALFGSLALGLAIYRRRR